MLAEIWQARALSRENLRVEVSLKGIVLAGMVLTWSATTAAQTEKTPPPTTVDASRGGITISSGVNSLTLGARTQFRWTLDQREQSDSDTIGAGVGRKDGPLSGFDIPRLRLTLSGGVYRPWLRYSLQFELHRTAGEGGSRMKDAFVEIRPSGRPYRLQLGQFKVPFGLQQLTSSARLQFVDRSFTDAKFNPSRDMGVMFSGTAVGRKMGYDLGVFNGAGESLRQNNRSHLWAARVYVDPLRPYALSEGAVEGTPEPALHFGFAVRGGKPIRGRSASGVFDNADDQNGYNVEFAFRQARFFSTAEYFWAIDEQQSPTIGRDIDSRGYHAQAGFMAVPRRLEVALLHARIEGNTDIDDAALTETRGVVSYYLHGHHVKVQADVGYIGYGARYSSLSSRARQGLPALGTRLVGGRALNDTQVRVQLQVAF